MKPEAERAREVVPTGLRIPFDLRAALEREAEINGRTLTGEILQRLRRSLEEAHVSTTVPRTGEPAPPIYASQQRAMTDSQRMLLGLFDALPPDKQLALLTVLRR